MPITLLSVQEVACGLVARFAVLVVAIVFVGPGGAPADAAEGRSAQFMAFVCGNAICRIGADGRGLRHLTSPKLGSGVDENPVWSPDGRRILFTRLQIGDSARDGTDLYVMDADGTNKRRLANHNVVTLPSWSPDGTRIAFQAWPDSHDGGIYLVRPDGTGMVRIVRGKPLELELGSAPWSPDSRKLVYSSQGHIWVIGSDGRGSRRLTSSFYDRRPALSPDGKHLTFSRARTGGLLEDSFLYISAADGTHARRFAAMDAAVWLPDSKKIAFVTDGGVRIAEIAPGGKRRTVAANKCCWTTFDVSPDSTLIAFDVLRGNPRDPDFDIYLADGTKQWRLVSGEQPAWAPRRSTG